MRRLIIAAAFSTTVIAACGSSSTSSGTGTGAGAGGSSSAGAAAGGSPTVAVGTTAKVGPVLTDAQGHTLYYFLPEMGGTIACTGSCATTWPPAKVTGTPIAGSGVTGTLGTVSLSDGSTQVSYQQWPLHTYAGDMAAGDANGQGIAGKWFAATPGLTASGSTPAGGAGGTTSSTSTTSSSSPYGY